MHLCGAARIAAAGQVLASRRRGGKGEDEARNKYGLVILMFRTNLMVMPLFSCSMVRFVLYYMFVHGFGGFLTLIVPAITAKHMQTSIHSLYIYLSLSLSLYIYIYNVYVCVYMYMYVYIYIHACMCVSISLYIYIYVYIYIVLCIRHRPAQARSPRRPRDGRRPRSCCRRWPPGSPCLLGWYTYSMVIV